MYFLKLIRFIKIALAVMMKFPDITMDMTHPFRLYRTDFEKVSDVWKNSVNKIVPFAHSGRFVGYHGLPPPLQRDA